MLNQVALMGRIAKDPELKQTASGVSVSTFTLAVSRSFCKQGEERQTDFIDIVAWRNTADFICRFFKKGQMMAVEGSIQTRTYTDKEGKNRKAFEVLANNVYFTESRSASSGASASAPSSNDPPVMGNPQITETAYSSGNNDDFAVISGDDDLPF